MTERTQNTGDPTAFPTQFVSLVKINPQAVAGQSPKKLWQSLERQIEAAGGRVQASYDMPFSGEYNLMLIGEADHPQSILRIDAACRYEPGVFSAQTTPVVPAQQHFEQVEQLQKTLAGSASR